MEYHSLLFHNKFQVTGQTLFSPFLSVNDFYSSLLTAIKAGNCKQCSLGKKRKEIKMVYRSFRNIPAFTCLIQYVPI